MTSWPTSSGVSPEEAAQELLSRRLARRSLLHFTNYTFPNYVAEPAHELIAATLDRVVEGTLDRLIICAPPQHGKSELVSVRFPAYWMGRRPDDPVILASYDYNLAVSKSRQARDIVESDDYRNLFGDRATLAIPPVRTRGDSRAVDEWRLAAPYRGGIRAQGVGGGLTGHPAKLGIIDDPIASWQEAQSAILREKVWDWYRSVFRTRVHEGGAIVIIMTRWHEQDLIGKLLALHPGRWTVLRLPALAETQNERDDAQRRMGLPEGQPDPLNREPGEALCPRRFSQAALEEIQSDVGPLVWISEYQAAPRAPEGNRFKRSWFPIVDAVPAKVRRARYWDKAGSQGSGKFTAGVLIALDEDGVIFIEDVVRGQWEAGEREKTIRQTAELDAIRTKSRTAIQIYVEQEPGSGGKESAQATIKNLAGFRIERDLPSGDKDVRLEPFAAQAFAGNVRLVRGLWNEAYIDEMTAIPNGTYRDQADATAGAYNRLTEGRKVGTVSAQVAGLWSKG